MLFVGLILLYLAINKKFEPLLLVPIGFGTILSNIPEIGLAYSGLEKIIFENDPETLSNLAMLLGLDFINADVSTLNLNDKITIEDLKDENYSFIHPDNMVVCQVKMSRASMSLETETDEEEGEEDDEKESEDEGEPYNPMEVNSSAGYASASNARIVAKKKAWWGGGERWKSSLTS